MQKKHIGFMIVSLIFIFSCGTPDRTCGEDLSCFIKSSETCTPNNVSYTISINILGILNEPTTYMEIKGEKEGFCELYIKNIDVNIRYTDEILEIMKASGTSDEEINAQLEESKKAVLGQIGKDGICTFTNEELVSMFTRWSNKDFSSEDFPENKCRGSFFGDEEDKLGSKMPERSSEKIVVEEEINGAKVTIKTGGPSREKECVFDKDCEMGFHCANEKCLLNSIFNDKVDCPNNACPQNCVNCEKGNFRCMLTETDFNNQKCVECYTDRHCNSGFECVSYECVTEQSPTETKILTKNVGKEPILDEPTDDNWCIPVVNDMEGVTSEVFGVEQVKIGDSFVNACHSMLDTPSLGVVTNSWETYKQYYYKQVTTTPNGVQLITERWPESGKTCSKQYDSIGTVLFPKTCM